MNVLMDKKVTLESMLGDPNLFLQKIDVRRRKATLFSMTPEMYASWAFHDSRAEVSADRRFVIDLDELFDSLNNTQLPFVQRIHFAGSIPVSRSNLTPY